MFIESERNDGYAYVCLDAPGMGKTTTVVRAANDAKCLHVMLHGSTGIMSSTVRKLLSLYEAASEDGLIRGNAACEIAVRVWKVAFVKVFERAAARLQETPNRQIGLLEAHGPDWNLLLNDDVDGLLSAAKANLKTVMMDNWNGTQRVVLHIDEIQNLVGHNRAAAIPSPATVCSAEEAMTYTHVWFTQALLEICSSDSYKLCITGISSAANNCIKLDGALKGWPSPPLPFFSESLTKTVLQQVLAFEDPEVYDALAAGCYGCPRAVQYVLLILRDTTETWTVRDILEQAQDRWRGGAHNCFIQGSKENAKIALQALFATMFPELYNAARKVHDGTPCAFFAHRVPSSVLEKDSNAKTLDDVTDACLPEAFLECSKQGVIRLREEETGVTLFPPYPFLTMYLRYIGAQFLVPQDCVSLVRKAHSFVSVAGFECRGNVCASLLALELCMPTSPLLSAIADEVHKKGDPVLTPCSIEMGIKTCLTHEELRSAFECDKAKRDWHVYIALDGDAPPTRSCNVAVPFFIGEEATLVMVHANTAHVEVSEGVSLDLHIATATTYSLPCYITDKDLGGPQNLSATPLLDTSNATIGAARGKGLLVLSDEILNKCYLNLRAALHAESHAGFDWTPLIFLKQEARQMLYKREGTKAVEELESSMIEHNKSPSAADPVDVMLAPSFGAMALHTVGFVVDGVEYWKPSNITVAQLLQSVAPNLCRPLEDLWFVRLSGEDDSKVGRLEPGGIVVHLFQRLRRSRFAVYDKLVGKQWACDLISESD